MDILEAVVCCAVVYCVILSICFLVNPCWYKFDGQNIRKISSTTSYDFGASAKLSM